MQTVYGAASLAAESGEEPGVLRQQVTSPNGTTAAALGVLMGEDRLTNLLTQAVEAARLRSVELGKYEPQLSLILGHRPAALARSGLEIAGDGSQPVRQRNRPPSASARIQALR